MHPPPISYSKIFSLEATLCGERISYSSKPGLPNWDRVSPSVYLLAEYVDVNPTDRILMLGSVHAALVVYLSQQLSSGEIVVMDNNCIAQKLVTITARENNIININIEENIELDPACYSTFDTAIIGQPKGRNLAQRWIVNANNALRPGGDLYISGANDLGVRSSIKDAESIVGTANVLGYKKGHRVARIKKHQSKIDEPTWSYTPGVSTGTWHKFKVDVRGETILIHSLPGIFSHDRLDEGTRLLLNTLKIHQGDQVLDLGCGYGVIGLTAARLGAGHVTLVDNNLLATSAALKNIRANGIEKAGVVISDVLDAVSTRNLDLIISNPPFHIGKDVDYLVVQAFIKQSWNALREGGNLMLVANKFLRYKGIADEYFSCSECVTETNRYQVLKATK